jgi:hypothetical protein
MILYILWLGRSTTSWEWWPGVHCHYEWSPSTSFAQTLGTRQSVLVRNLHYRYIHRYCVLNCKEWLLFFSEGGCRPCTISVLLYYPRLEVSADLKLLEQLCCSTDGKSRLATVERRTFKRSLTAVRAKMVGFEKRKSQTRSSLRYFRRHLVRGAGQNPIGREARAKTRCIMMRRRIVE